MLPDLMIFYLMCNLLLPVVVPFKPRQPAPSPLQHVSPGACPPSTRQQQSTDVDALRATRPVAAPRPPPKPRVCCLAVDTAVMYLLIL